MAKRRFELEDGTSAKFWEIATKGKTITVTFGRLGTNGQTKTKVHPSPKAAREAAEKAIVQKLKKGYAEAGGAGKGEKPAAATDFQPLSDPDLLKLAKECRHPGIKACLKEIGGDGIDGYDGRFLIHEGDLIADGAFDPEDVTVLVVRGNLEVSGLYRDRCDDAPACTIVFGDLRCKNALTAGFLEVTGKLIAQDAVVGDYNDGGALIHGDLRAQLFLPFDHGFRVLGETVVKERLDALTLKKKPTRLAEAYYAKQPDGAFQLFAGERDDRQLDRALRAGESILR